MLLFAGVSWAAEDYSKWSYSNEIVLDTTAAGADVQTEVRNAPILVRLELGAAAMPGLLTNGSDLRFATIDGKPLAYEIERWDLRLKRAEVWVVMDVVKGNTRAEAIRMYWGNTGVPPASDGPAVFTAEKDFIAVWHLSGSAGNMPAGHRDSGPNGAHGTGVNLTRSSGVDGVIAGGQDFEDSDNDGSGQMIGIDPTKRPLFTMKTGMTQSSWVKIESWTRMWQTIIAKGNKEWRMSRVAGQAGIEFCMDNLRPHCAVGTIPVADGKWHHLVGVWTGPTLDIYVDGVLDQSRPIKEGTVNSATDFDVLIGENNEKPGRMFDGVIDEIQVIGAARDAAWVKLTYENQRPGGKLVTFTKPSKTSKIASR
jgi:hypothetical protein